MSRRNRVVDPVPTIFRIEASDIADPIRPGHYRGDLVMRIIEKFDLGFRLGNVVKYLLRHKNKSGIEDLKKARWYLEREISFLEGTTKALED